MKKSELYAIVQQIVEQTLKNQIKELHSIIRTQMVDILKQMIGQVNETPSLNIKQSNQNIVPKDNKRKQPSQKKPVVESQRGAS